ncbi:hypothetical protein D3C86_1723650 [compost metagenome]
MLPSRSEEHHAATVCALCDHVRYDSGSLTAMPDKRLIYAIGVPLAARRHNQAAGIVMILSDSNRNRRQIALLQQGMSANSVNPGGEVRVTAA